MRDLVVSFGEAPFLEIEGLEVAKGEILALLGPSGCGKTTLLRSLAGLQEVAAGQVHLEGVPITHLPAEVRGIGMVFQSPTLFPHLDVAGNLALALPLPPPRERVRQLVTRRPDQDRTEKVEKILRLVGLPRFGARAIETLSGGEAQRVALARALLLKPRLLLLDEPLSALDRSLRETLRRELRAILKQVGVTAIYVTHDQGEAVAVADRIALMRQGRLLQVDSPSRLYSSPRDTWVARFLGLHNLVRCQVRSIDDGSIKVGTALQGLEQLVLPSPAAIQEAGAWQLLFGPGSLEIAREDHVGPRIQVRVMERELGPRGLRLRVEPLTIDGEQGEAEMLLELSRNGTNQELGQRLELVVDLERLSLIRKA